MGFVWSLITWAGLEGYYLWVDSLHHCENAYTRSPWMGSASWISDRIDYSNGCGWEFGATKTVRCGNKHACCCPDGYWAPHGAIGNWNQFIKGGLKNVGCTKCFVKPNCSNFASKDQCEYYAPRHNCDCDKIFPVYALVDDATSCEAKGMRTIKTAYECAAAASMLHLADIEAADVSVANTPNRKEGCIVNTQNKYASLITGSQKQDEPCASDGYAGCVCAINKKSTCYRSLGNSYCRGMNGQKADMDQLELHDMNADECRMECTKDPYCYGYHTQNDGRCYIYSEPPTSIKSNQRVGECFQKYECGEEMYLNLESGKSGHHDGDSVEISCPTDYTMTDCQCFSPWKDCEGAMIVGNKCRAINGGSKGVYARARCLKGITSISTQISKKSGHHDDDKASTTCPSGTHLIGCTCQSSGGSCDGAKPSENTCTAQNGLGGKGVYARAVCAVIPEAIFKQVDSEKPSSKNDDARATATCPQDYILTGCSCRSPHKNCDGAFYDGQRVCRAQAGNRGYEVTAHAICVKLSPTA